MGFRPGQLDGGLGLESASQALWMEWVACDVCCPSHSSRTLSCLLAQQCRDEQVRVVAALSAGLSHSGAQHRSSRGHTEGDLETTR